MEDRRIINMFFSRDESAIRETEQKYGSFCYRIAFNILWHREDAEESVNDTYFTAWKKIPPLLPENFKAFLGKLTRDISIGKYRVMHAKKRFHALELMLSELDECIPDSRDTEDAIEEIEMTGIIYDWLYSLEENDRALFIRRYYFGDAVKSLAEEARCTQNQMAQRMLRLRQKLKARLEAEGYTRSTSVKSYIT